MKRGARQDAVGTIEVVEIADSQVNYSIPLLPAKIVFGARMNF